jgi:GTPase SAR1 family protein
MINSLLNNKKKNGLINIYGLGGVGKTSIVREMVEKKHPEQVVWLTAKKHYFEGDELYRNPLTESITLQQIYRKIASSFGQNYLEELVDIKEQKGRLQWLQYLLKKEERLVVVDNFETIDEDFKQFLNETRILFNEGPSKMIITSRFDLKKYPFVFNFKLNGLSENDTLALFTHELEKSGEGVGIALDTKEIKDIYAITRGLPLAIKLIAARIRSSDIAALDYILERLQKIDFAKEEDIYEKFYKFIYLDIWNSLESDTRNLLVLLSALAPGEDIRISYLLRIIAENINEYISEEIFWKSFEEIKKYSLVDTRKGDPSLFSMHPLTQSFIKAEILQMDEHDGFKNL